ncbi:hypothetical protein WEI85_19020 [Actinomycetes bacterium KLBMP 9797]
MGQFFLGSGEADAESFGFAEPAFTLCFGYAGGEIVADVDQALPLAGINAKEWATNAAVFVNTAGAICAAAVAEGEPAAFKVAEKLVPFRVGGVPVFLAGTQAAAAGDKGPMPVDGYLG